MWSHAAAAAFSAARGRARTHRKGAEVVIIQVSLLSLSNCIWTSSQICPLIMIDSNSRTRKIKHKTVHLSWLLTSVEIWSCSFLNKVLLCGCAQVFLFWFPLFLVGESSISECFFTFFLFSNHGNYLHKQLNCTVYSLNKEMVPCWSVFHETRIQLWCSRCKRSAVSTIWSEGKMKSALSVFSYIAYNACQICLTLFSRGWPLAACLAKLEKRGAHLLTAS